MPTASFFLASSSVSCALRSISALVISSFRRVGRLALAFGLEEVELLLEPGLALLDVLDALLDFLHALVVVAQVAGACLLDVLLAGVGGEQRAVAALRVLGGGVQLAFLLRFGFLGDSRLLVALGVDALHHQTLLVNKLERPAEAGVGNGRAVVFLAVVADAAIRVLAALRLREHHQRRGRSARPRPRLRAELSSHPSQARIPTILTC